ncbi:MAG: ABC transporter ATP-binding protein [Hyphomicrobiaceae bacterium]
MSLLSVGGLHVSRGGRVVLHDVSLEIDTGEVVAVLGPNGSGKSTLLAAVLGLIPASGSVELLGRPARHLSSREKGRLAAYLPQHRDTAWPMSVEAIVELGRLPHRSGFSGLSATDRLAIERAMTAVDVTGLRHRRISELSGGETTRVLMARTLAQDAPLLLADEPTSGLDPSHQIGLLELFRRQAARGRSVLLTLHELHLAGRWCDRVVLLQDGRVAASGPPEAVLTRDRIADVYGCTAYVARDADGLVIAPTGLVDRSGAADR